MFHISKHFHGTQSSLIASLVAGAALFSGCGKFAAKPEISATILSLQEGAKSGPPSIPANLSAAAMSSSEIKLVWGASRPSRGTTITGYRIVRNGSFLADVSGSVLTYLDQGLSPSTTYSYQVAALSSNGKQSSLSGAVSATTGPGAIVTACIVQVVSCPLHPEYTNQTVNDNWDGAESSQDRCLLRASEYSIWCASTDPVTSTFFQNGVALASTTVAPQTPTQPTPAPTATPSPTPFPTPGPTPTPAPTATPIPGVCPAAGTLIKTYVIREAFGVSHPDQIIDLDLPEGLPNGCELRMTDGAGVDVLSQVLLEGKIAVRTDLPAGASKTWRLYSGRPSMILSSGLTLQDLGTYFEITNGLTGVRVSKVPGGGSSPLAPIQGIRYRDGSWTASAANYLGNPLKGQGNSFNYDQTFVSMSAEILASGPLKNIVKVTYLYNRTDLVINNDFYWPAGLGHFSSTLELQAGQPSVLIEDEADLGIMYTVNGYIGNVPNQGRYRGHSAYSTEFGYSPDGKVWDTVYGRFQYDAMFNIQYTRPMRSEYTSMSGEAYKRVGAWDMSTYNSGWATMLYNKDASGSGNIFGWYLGAASRALGTGATGIGVVTAPGGLAGVQMTMNPGSPSNYPSKFERFSWGIFVGTKGQDLLPISPCMSWDNMSGWCQDAETIYRQMNIHGGISLNKIYRYQLEYNDPPGGVRPLYLEPEVYNNLVSRVRSDYNYYDYILHKNPESTSIFELWRDPAGQPLTNMYSDVVTTANLLLDAYVNGNGVYDGRYLYWMGGMQMAGRGTGIQEMLLDPAITATQKANIKAAAALFANIVWDNDFVPLDNAALAGINLGTSNMPPQMVSYRDFFALSLAEHPMMASRLPGVAARAKQQIATSLNSSGAHMSSPGYSQTFGTVVSVAQQLKMTGAANLYATDSGIAKYSEFLMNLLTPPEVRFGGERKIPSIGDGATQSSWFFGLLANGLWDVNPDLSARLMGAWKQSGSVYTGNTVLMFNDLLPTKDPNLVSVNLDDYASVLRNGWGTANESALFFLNGSFYRDHRHKDHGSFSLYALGAPLSIDWGSQYYPKVEGGYVHNTVLPESSLGQPWNQDVSSLDLGGTLGDSAVQLDFQSYALSSRSKGQFRNDWTRTITSIHPNENTPIYLIQDDFSGANAGQSKILTLNMMADGAVSTPSGLVSPLLRTDPELPSGGIIYNMVAGLNRMFFQGQWLIDWDLYSLNSTGQQFMIGNWAEKWHNYYEMQEFQKVNGRPFEERQHILRIRGSGPFTTLIMPFKKGMRPADRNVIQQGGAIIINEGGATTRVTGSYYSYQNSAWQALTTFDASPASEAGIEASGGPVEVIVTASSIRLTAHGAPGVRNLVLPGLGVYSLSYSGGAPLVVNLNR